MSFTAALRPAGKLLGMKKIMALAGVTVALVGALALTACAPRADQANRNNDGTTQQQQPAAPNQPAPAANNDPADTSSVDNDLNNVDSTMGGIDSDLSAAAQAPGDAD
jgi:hypothetical protein